MLTEPSTPLGVSVVAPVTHPVAVEPTPALSLAVAPAALQHSTASVTLLLSRQPARALPAAAVLMLPVVVVVVLQLGGPLAALCALLVAAPAEL